MINRYKSKRIRRYRMRTKRVANLSKTHEKLKKIVRRMKPYEKLVYSLHPYVSRDDLGLEDHKTFLMYVADRINMDIGRRVTFIDKRLITFEATGTATFPFHMLRFDKCWPNTDLDCAKLHMDKSFRTIVLASYQMPTIHKWKVTLWSVDDKRINRNGEV